MLTPSLASVADRVAEDVLARAAEQLGLTGDNDVGACSEFRLEINAAASTGRLQRSLRSSQPGTKHSNMWIVLGHREKLQSLFMDASGTNTQSANMHDCPRAIRISGTKSWISMSNEISEL